MSVIDPVTHIGAVHLTISSLQQSVAFYTAHLGLKVHRRNDRQAWLGAGASDLLVLSRCERAPRVRGTTGLYHFAVLVPSRIELARSLKRLIETETVMQGAADHGVSEALYLADPDGNGIEIYRDRPRTEWPVRGGRLQMGADPIDLEALLGTLDGLPDSWSGQDRATTVGHVHLHVSNLRDAEAFYNGVLGFEVMQRWGASALFVSAGGYHHHVGLNTWAGVGAPPAPSGAIGLRYFVLALPSEAAQAEVLRRVEQADIKTTVEEQGIVVRDPSGNVILLAHPSQS